MTDITERLRQNARSEDCFTDPYPDVLTDAADEIDRLRAHVADTDGAITVLGFQNAELRARVAELEAARGEPVAWLVDDPACPYFVTVVTELALARGIPTTPLYTAPPAPVVDVDKISEVRLRAGAHAIYKLTEFAPTPDEMRAAIRAIFNAGQAKDGAP